VNACHESTDCQSHAVKVLFDMVHPADVHFFRHAIQQLQQRGDAICVTSRDKDVTLELLDGFGIRHTSISRKGRGATGLFLELLSRDIKLYRVARKFRPDIIVSNNSPTGAHVAWLLRIPSIVFDDTEIHRFNRILYRLLVSEAHSPDCYRLSLGRKHRLYPGYHSLAYLHPDHFRPDPDVVRAMGLDPDDRMVLLRFVSWGAMHDVGLGGLSDDDKLGLVRKLESHARVLISAEGALEGALQTYRIDIPLTDMHHLLAFVDVVIGESATMCSEAATLGTPAIYIDEKGRGYTDELEQKYGLCFNYRPDDYAGIEAKALELLALDDARGHFLAAHARMLADKINVSAYQVEQIDRLVARGR
jgi:predicted glycosyltransferase